MDSLTAETNYKMRRGSFKCKLPNCELCINGSERFCINYELKKHGWRRRLIIVFSTVSKSTGETWLSLMKDIYPFVEAHWRMFWPNLTQAEYPNWKKKVQDSLSHSKEIFESGTAIFGKKGYWRLIEHLQVGFPQENSQTNFSNINFYHSNQNTSEQSNFQPLPQFQFTPSPVFLTDSSPLHQFNNLEVSIPETIQTGEIFGSAVDGTLEKDFDNYLVRIGIKKL